MTRTLIAWGVVMFLMGIGSSHAEVSSRVAEAEKLERDGDVYLNRALSMRDSAKALALYEKSYAMSPRPELAFKIGDLYTTWSGGVTEVSLDPARGLQWFTRCADAGYPPCIERSARMYFSGHGTAVNYPEALRLYKILAEKDDLEAIEWVASIYRSGLGVRIDIAESDRWLQRIAQIKQKKADRVKAQEEALKKRDRKIYEQGKAIKSALWGLLLGTIAYVILEHMRLSRPLRVVLQGLAIVGIVFSLRMDPNLWKFLSRPLNHPETAEGLSVYWLEVLMGFVWVEFLLARDLVQQGEVGHWLFAPPTAFLLMSVHSLSIVQCLLIGAPIGFGIGWLVRRRWGNRVQSLIQ